MRNRGLRVAFGLSAGVALIALAAGPLDAHKGITSKYTYNDDVYPILRDKCGRCHVDGGPTPMSLLTYQDNGGAVAWATSISEMLKAGAMPPYYADPTGPAVKNHHGLSPREVDILMTWANGGTPQGDMHKKPGPSEAKHAWPLGAPDITLKIDKEVTLGPGVMEDTLDITVPTNLTEAKWIRAADLMPGTPSIVRQATISVEGGPTLAEWEPADDPVATPSGAGFKLQPGAKLKVHIRYKKGYTDEQVNKSDKSTIGLYVTDEPLSGKEIQALTIDSPSEGQSNFSGTVETSGRVLALRPRVDQPMRSMSIVAVAPNGRRVPLLKLGAIRPEWPRRYWLAEPVELPKGTKIEVTTEAGDPDSGPLAPPVKSPLQVALDYVPL